MGLLLKAHKYLTIFISIEAEIINTMVLGLTRSCHNEMLAETGAVAWSEQS